MIDKLNDMYKQAKLDNGSDLDTTERAELEMEEEQAPAEPAELAADDSNARLQEEDEQGSPDLKTPLPALPLS